MKRRIICIFLILIFILPYFIVNVSNGAGEDVTFSISSQNAKRGDVITVLVDMNCINNFVAANFELNYNSNVLEYVPFTTGGEVDYTQNCGPIILNNGSSPATVLINSNTAGKIKIGYMSQTSIAGKSGQLFIFKFNVKSNAPYGNSEVSLSTTTLKNSNGNNLNASYQSGYIGVISGINMSTSTMSLTTGESNQLSVTSPQGTIYDNVSWTSSNSSVASVTVGSDSKTATITANSAGTATITALLDGLSTTCTITVSAPVEQYTISIGNPVWSFLPRTQTRNLEATFNPSSSAEGKTLTWSSSNTSVATINSTTGKITAVANGTTTITVTDGTKSATYTLTVNKMLGDADNDVKITSYDAYRALKLSTDQNAGYNIDQDEVVILDVERNGDISSNDAYLILKHSVGLISSFN